MSEEYIGWLDDEWNTVLDQSQPIVRCRDCEFSVDGGKYCSKSCIDSWDWRNVEPDGFCAWASRRES